MIHNQFSSVTQSCWTLCDPMDCSMPGLPVHSLLLELAQTHVHWVPDAIKPSHPLSSSSPPALNLFQHQGLFQWVSSSHQVTKVLELQLQHQPFQWIFSEKKKNIYVYVYPLSLEPPPDPVPLGCHRAQGPCAFKNNTYS